MTATPVTLGRALLRRHWVVWGCALLGGALALGAAQVLPPTYEATALLSVDETPDATQGFDVAMQVDQFLAQRFVAMATSQAVLQAVCQREGAGCSTAALARRVRVTVPTAATGQLAVVADAGTPAAAARLADETAQAVVARNQSLAAAQVAAEKTSLTAQLQQLDAETAQTLAQATADEAAGRTDAALVARLTAEQTDRTATFTRLQDLQAQEQRAADVISVQQPASLPVQPADPRPQLYLLVGAAGGLALGVLLALASELLRRRVQDAAEVGDIAGSPLVLDLSHRRPGAPAGPARLLLRAGLAGRDDRPRELVVAGASAREPVNEVAVALARTVASPRARVLVALAPSAAALPDALPAGADPDGAEAPPVAAVPGGRPLRADGFDLVIHCVRSPEDDGADWLRPGLSAAILVATRGRTRFAEARRTAALLRHAGVRTVGAVLLPGRPGAARRALRAQPETAAAAGPVLET